MFNVGAATKGAASLSQGSESAAEFDTQPHKHRITHTPEDTWEHTKHTGLLHSRPFHRLSYIHGAFGAFIRRDGCC